MASNSEIQGADLSIYPGGDLVAKGLKDVSAHRMSDEALLVLIAQPRLEDLGFKIEDPFRLDRPYEHALYEALEDREMRGAHLAYNALIGRIVSFANAYSHHLTWQKNERTPT